MKPMQPKQHQQEQQNKNREYLQQIEFPWQSGEILNPLRTGLKHCSCGFGFGLSGAEVQGHCCRPLLGPDDMQGSITQVLSLGVGVFEAVIQVRLDSTELTLGLSWSAGNGNSE